MDTAGSKATLPRQRQGGLAFLLLSAAAALAAPITVLDRIGTNSTSTDFQPGGAIMRYTSGSRTNGGACGTVWTQPFKGTLAEIAFVLCPRVVNASNGLYLASVTNLSAFQLNLHVWTNGAAGFLSGSNALRGDVVLPLGPGPDAPAWWGVTALTNSVVNSTNLYPSILPTFRLTTNLAARALRLEQGREYVLALSFEGGSGNTVIRHCLAAETGSPDVLARWTPSDGLTAGHATNAAAPVRFAASISVEPDPAPGPLHISQSEGRIALSWPEDSGGSGSTELWRATNLICWAHPGNRWPGR